MIAEIFEVLGKCYSGKQSKCKQINSCSRVLASIIMTSVKLSAVRKSYDEPIIEVANINELSKR
jgi:hypothetical protein